MGSIGLHRALFLLASIGFYGVLQVIEGSTGFCKQGFVEFLRWSGASSRFMEGSIEFKARASDSGWTLQALGCRVLRFRSSG